MLERLSISEPKAESKSSPLSPNPFEVRERPETPETLSAKKGAFNSLQWVVAQVSD